MYSIFLVVAAEGFEKYGVFAAVGATAAALVASVTGMTLLWRGPLKGWDVPEYSTQLSRVAVLPTAFLVVLGFVYANPSTLNYVVFTGGGLTVVAAILAMRYLAACSRHKYYKEIVAGPGRTDKVFLLGGDRLTDWAKKTTDRSNISVQECLKGTPGSPYDSDKVWPREARVRVYSAVSTLFVGMVICGTGGLATLSYAVEVHLLQRPASAILSPKDLSAR